MTSKPRYINDPVHGPIELTSTEWALINTKAFQRLRRIKQLGLVDLVFPGAEHSRFTHSLGTLAMMGTLIRFLPAKPEFRRQLDALTPTLRAAALLHDIGHFPLSHLFESVYGHWTRTKWNLEDVDRPEPSAPSLQEAAHLLSHKPSKDFGYNHERMSAEVVLHRKEIREILDRARPRIFTGLVAKLICGDFVREPDGSGIDSGGSDGSSWRIPEVPIAAALLMHSSLDADRLDYLKRDCVETGMVYGQVDEAYISRMLQIAPAKEDPTQFVIALPLKAIRAADHYMLARFHFYTQIIYHKTVSAFNIVAGALLLYLLRNEELAPYDDYRSVRYLVNTDYFLNFTDHLFWDKVRSLLGDDSLPGAWARTLYYRLRPETLKLKELFVDRKRSRPTNRLADDVADLETACVKYGRDPDRSFLQHTSLKLADIDRSYKATKPRLLVGDVAEALRVLDTQNNVAVCLADRPDSLTHKLADQLWRRDAVYTLDATALAVPKTSRLQESLEQLMAIERLESLERKEQEVRNRLASAPLDGPRRLA